MRKPLADLYERVLRVTRFAAIGEVGVEIGVAELAAEPGAVPEEKRQQYKS